MHKANLKTLLTSPYEVLNKTCRFWESFEVMLSDIIFIAFSNLSFLIGDILLKHSVVFISVIQLGSDYFRHVDWLVRGHVTLGFACSKLL